MLHSTMLVYDNLTHIHIYIERGLTAAYKFLVDGEHALGACGVVQDRSRSAWHEVIWDDNCL